MDAVSPDLPEFLKAVIALIAVLALMSGLAFALKKLGLVAQVNIKSGVKRRLKIIESLPLDARRRLVIIECDGQQHLIVLGINGETLITSNLSPVDGSPSGHQAS